MAMSDPSQSNPLSKSRLSAEEVAEEIFLILQLPTTYDKRNGIPESAYIAVAQALTAYGEAYQLKGERQSCAECMDHAATKARAEALEEAAKVCERHDL